MPATTNADTVNDVPIGCFLVSNDVLRRCQQRRGGTSNEPPRVSRQTDTLHLQPLCVQYQEHLAVQVVQADLQRMCVHFSLLCSLQGTLRFPHRLAQDTQTENRHGSPGMGIWGWRDPAAAWGAQLSLVLSPLTQISAAT